MLNVLCVEDDRQALQQLMALCGRIPEMGAVHGAARAGEALAWLEDHPCGLALLDIGLPDTDGITLARKIRERWPGTAIIFVTASPAYAVDAWTIHAEGYILKPATEERLRAEVGHLLAGRAAPVPERPVPRVSVKTFGAFDVLVDGEPVHFRRAKAKELLAFLVERQGESVTREEIWRVLWEGRPYDRPGQKQLDVILRSLRATLEENGIGGILSLQRGAIRVEPRCFTCDMYRLLLGDVTAIGEYRGEYMTAYSWASLQEAYLERRIENLT